jgi:hypothetical protein
VPLGVADVEVAVRGQPDEAGAEQLLDHAVDAVVLQQRAQGRPLLDILHDHLAGDALVGGAVARLGHHLVELAADLGDLLGRVVPPEDQEAEDVVEVALLGAQHGPLHSLICSSTSHYQRIASSVTKRSITRQRVPLSR